MIYLALILSLSLSPHIKHWPSPTTAPSDVDRLERRMRARSIAERTAAQRKVAARPDAETLLVRSLPRINRGMYVFARDHEGQQVRDGVCSSLVLAAEDFAGCSKVGPGDRGKPIGYDEILPGDIAFLVWTDEHGKKNNHIGIVMKKLGGGKFEMMNQNGPPNGKRAGRAVCDQHGQRQEWFFSRPGVNP